ncbi:MAG TPA: TolC family protein [Bacteroidales bacterium]|jgi:outer membrane protein|nr:TolC family protein [Bacteroidales bacterium]HNV95918.1 TolC family protein [Bacteroidales bacterium]HOU98555.1 TolC family protein [Bacteroidales bacterium]
MWQKNLLLLFLIFAIKIVPAQEKWSLERCILYALENNVQIKLQELNKKSSEAAFLKNKTMFLPTINANANQGYTVGHSVDPLTNEFAESNVKSNNFSLSSNWTLFNGFQNVNNLKQSYFNLQASLMDLEKAKNDISLNVASFYLQILLADELLQVAYNQKELSKTQVDRTKKLYAAGSVAQGTYLEMESQLASDEMQFVSAQNSLDLAKLNLVQLLDLGINDSIEIEKPILTDPDTLFPAINPQQIYEDAKRNLPTIRSVEYKMLAAQKGLAVARGYRSPRISLGGSYATGYSSQRKSITDVSLDNPYISGFAVDGSGNQYPVYSYSMKYNYQTTDFNQQLKDNISKSLSINLTIPIFNNWQANYAVSSAKINALNSKYQYEIADKQLVKEIRQAYNDAVAAFKKYVAAKKAEKASSESFKYTEQRFNVGLANTYDYNLSKTNLMRAQSEVIKSKYEYTFKLKILDFYSGKPFKL